MCGGEGAASQICSQATNRRGVESGIDHVLVDLKVFSRRITKLVARLAEGIYAQRDGALDPSATPLQPVERVLRDRILM